MDVRFYPQGTAADPSEAETAVIRFGIMSASADPNPAPSLAREASRGILDKTRKEAVKRINVSQPPAFVLIYLSYFVTTTIRWATLDLLPSESVT